MDGLAAEIDRIVRVGEADRDNTYLQDGIRYCQSCKKPVEMIREVFGQERRLPIMCDCQKEKERQMREQRHLLELADARRRCFDGEYARLSGATLAECSLEHPKEAEIMQRYVDKFSEMYRQQTGLLLWGENGTGKSYMAAALCNALIDGGHDCYFTTFSRIDRQASGLRLDRQAYIDSINDHSLLVLDDLGAERSSEYMQELVFSVIDSRYESGKPMVITTNLTINDLKNPQTAMQSRVYDRILQICHSVKMSGESLRRKDTIKRFYEMKKELENES